ncbi:MAG: hypothetical protein M1819_000900 [Sarea resinae]|nr:MAG: hypothetical protein M1819_000900 [Sarea resinae]
MDPIASSAPFTRVVIDSMRKLYPEALADKSWDNTGLLLEAPFDPIRRQMNSVLLTVDLTRAVAEEAIERKDSVVIAYHPIIFRGLKSLSLADSQQSSLLRLAQEGISVYSPHTAIDAAAGGLGDWLADIVTGIPTGQPEEEAEEEQSTESETEGQENGDAETPEESKTSEPSTPGTQNADLDADDVFGGPSIQEDQQPQPPRYSSPTYPRRQTKKGSEVTAAAAAADNADSASTTHTRTTITPDPNFPNAGMGRLIRFPAPVPLETLISRIATALGSPKAIPLAIPQGRSISDISIRGVAVCAGSGAGLFKELDRVDGGAEADLLFTGEMSHHDALAAIEKGKSVLTLFHSNTERGFLHEVLRPQLEKEIKARWTEFREDKVKELRDAKGGVGTTPMMNMGEWEEALEDEDVCVEVSERDRDPFGVVIARDT